MSRIGVRFRKMSYSETMRKRSLSSGRGDLALERMEYRKQVLTPHPAFGHLLPEKKDIGEPYSDSKPDLSAKLALVLDFKIFKGQITIPEIKRPAARFCVVQIKSVPVKRLGDQANGVAPVVADDVDVGG